MINVLKIRQDFEILKRKVNGRPLVYLDNAATSQKPRQVLAAIDDYYRSHNANVHRGIHTLSVEATEAYEAARKKVADFVGVSDSAEIIFTRNATEAINLVAYSWGRLNIGKGDEIVLTVAEHHSNFVPWQQLALENGAIVKIIPIRQVFDHEAQTESAQGKPIDENGELDLEAFKKALTKKTKLVTFFHVSNVLGTINDVDSLSSIVHRLAPKAKILIDGAQAVPHMKVDVAKIGCDFYVFTGHKMLGPTGIGVLWGKREILEQMAPFMFGGEMISTVGFGGSTWNELPWKFEAGTPNIAGAIGLGAAIDYLSEVGMDNVRRHEVELTKYALDQLSKIEGVTTFGPKTRSTRHSEQSEESSKKRSFASAQDDIQRAGVISFNVGLPLRQGYEGQAVHAHDVASILDSEGIAIRSGHHCAQPLMEFLGIDSAARASFYLYNTKADVDTLVAGLKKVQQVFRLSGNQVLRKDKNLTARQPGVLTT